MQNACMGKLMELSEKDPDVLYLSADNGTGFDEAYRRNFPRQILNFGIAEENMVAAAAGMATAGKLPFVFTAGAFLAYRSMEFIRDDICFQNLNVKLVATGSGLVLSSLGPTHHTTEDISVLRTLPNLMILSPATPKQAAVCVELAYAHKGPVYLRIGMNHEKEFYPDDYNFDISKNNVLADGEDIAIFTTGSILAEVMEARAQLLADNISAKVINVCALKPFPAADVKECAGMRMIFSVEEHNIHGGLGGILAETIAYQGLSLQVCPIGLEDAFAAGYGTHDQVRRLNGLDAASICQKVKGVLHERV